MSDDAKRMREWLASATGNPVSAGERFHADASVEYILNALPAMLDDVEAARSATHGSVWAGRWNVYNNGDGWTAVVPSEGYLRDADGNVRRFQTLSAALMAIKEVKP